MPLDEMHNLRNLSTPFPTVIPPGITPVSFDNFETSSAIVFVDESDERVDPDKDSEELDGMGIVVTLLPTHAKPDAHGITGRRKKKSEDEFEDSDDEVEREMKKGGWVRWWVLQSHLPWLSTDAHM